MSIFLLPVCTLFLELLNFQPTFRITWYISSSFITAEPHELSLVNCELYFPLMYQKKKNNNNYRNCTWLCYIVREVEECIIKKIATTCTLWIYYQHHLFLSACAILWNRSTLSNEKKKWKEAFCFILQWTIYCKKLIN